ncbi:PaaI family thioesterase [Granulicella mallensis]|uniref:Phenylacetic acid degradation-related protein n=1 Tax=Granulicella mallensis (strain ATCC BAA-1857 / DSM 23137 / MP5ACTX8) TaxID=682795 RepID=G8NYS6_GRAMM|nr:PaaI family thioesterase [Granulicella mallensis]AEU34489.1 phenylacetic acid degradation-related protein [Granulicella mallensis MP5ACTX8]
MSKEQLQHEPCRIELTERDLHNSRSGVFLQDEGGGEASLKESRQIGVVSRDVLLAEDGMSFVTGMQNGRHPSAPYSDTTGIELVEVEEGRVVFIGRPGARYLNPVGTIHGGWAATILDAAMAYCVHSTLKAGENYTTLEMKINYIRPVLPSLGRVRCEGKVIHRGSRTATSEGRLFDERGKLLAHGSETCMIFPLSPCEKGS